MTEIIKSTETKTKTSKLLSILILILALLFGLISIILAFAGIKIIPLVLALVGFALFSTSWFFFKKSNRIFTIIVAGFLILAILVSIFRSVAFKNNVVTDSTIDTNIVKEKKGIEKKVKKTRRKKSNDTDNNLDKAVGSNDDKGELIYKAKCIVCHQANGMGIEGTYPPLAGSSFLVNTDRIISTVLFGNTEKLVVNGLSYNTQMPPLDLSDEETTYVLNYILNNWGNSYPPVTLKQVIALREAKTKKK